MLRLRLDRVTRFAVPVIALGAVVLGVAASTGAFAPLLEPSLVLVALFACTVLAELVELSIPRGDDEVRFTAGTPFGFAILLVFGAGAAIAGWTLAILVTEIVRRAPALKVAYNTAQYAIGMAAAGVVFEALAGP